jgi:hypothetical protein
LTARGTRQTVRPLRDASTGLYFLRRNGMDGYCMMERGTAPHLDCVNLVSWNWVRVLESHKRADTVQCRICIDFGVLGEHLGRGERAIYNPQPWEP